MQKEIKYLEMKLNTSAKILFAMKGSLFCVCYERNLTGVYTQPFTCKNTVCPLRNWPTFLFWTMKIYTTGSNGACMFIFYFETFISQNLKIPGPH